MSNWKKNASWFRVQMINKYMGIEERFLWWVGAFRVRLRRIRRHFLNGRAYRNAYKGELSEAELTTSQQNWFGTLLIYLVELGGIAEIYQTISEFVKFNTRILTKRELALAQSVFGDALSYELIRVDKRAFFGPKQMGIAYVSFHTINVWNDLPDHIFIHELVHVWQYEQMGAVYIPRALAAQRSEAGYNYGGVEALKMQQQRGLAAFNLEQQADIITDYFRLKNNQKPRWGKATPSDLEIYEPYRQEILNS